MSSAFTNFVSHLRVRKVLGPLACHLITVCAFGTSVFGASWDDALNDMRDGKALSTERREVLRRDFDSFYQLLTTKHRVRDSARFGEPDRTNFFVAAMKMAILDPREHGGWGFVSELRENAVKNLTESALAGSDPYARFAYIFPAAALDRPWQAAIAFDRLRREDRWLAGEAMRLASNFGFDPMQWIRIYLEAGRTADALDVAEMAAASGTPKGLEMKALLLEKLNRLEDAAAAYRVLGEKTGLRAVSAGFFTRHPSASANASLAELERTIFPEGVKELPTGPLPVAGVTLGNGVSEGWKNVLRPGEIIVGVDGKQVATSDQALFVAWKASGPVVMLTVHDGQSHKSKAIVPATLQRLMLQQVLHDALFGKG